MNFAFARHEYHTLQIHNDRLIDTPHGVIEKTLEVLLMELRCLKNIDSVDRRNQARTKSLLALNILQTSLDFKPDENLAENLFRLYEFIKNSVLSYKEKIDDLIASIQIVSELYESWCSINSKD